MGFESTDERLDRLEALVGQIIVAHEAAARRLERLEHTIEQMNKRWGELAMKMGTLVEDIVAPNLPRIAREQFGLGEDEFSALRLKVRHASDPARSREFDYVYAAPEGWIVNETKSSVQSKDVDDFLAVVGEINDYFPQYRSRRLYPILSSLYLREDVVKYCTRQRIYALGLGNDTMVLLNAEALRPEPST